MTAAPTAFAQAIEEFILELRHKSDKKSEFYKQVLDHINSGEFRRDDRDASKQWADSLAQTVDEIKAQHQSPSKSRRFADGLGSFINTFNDYAKVFDVMIQAAPDAAMLLYGGARLVLMLTKEVYDCYETVVIILEDISYNIKCYHQYAVAYDTSKDVQELLVKSYKAIVNFWLKASRLLSTKSIKALFSRNSQLSKEWQTHRVDLQRWHDRVRDAAQAAEAYSRKLREERNAVKAVEQARKDTMQNVVDWVKACQDEEKLDFRGKVRDNAALRHPSTCEWLFDHPEFQTWLAANKKAKLWLHSRPGVGKSILAAVVAQTLEERGLKIIPYFFSFNDILQRRPMTALKSIAVRLLSMYDSEGKSVPDSVQRLFEADAANYCTRLTDFNTAVKVVQGLLKQVGRIHIIVDGLDECDDRIAILKALCEISQTQTHGIVKWLFTSRAETEIQDYLQKFSFAEIDPPRGSLLNDVRKFMTDKLQNQLNINCEDTIDEWVSNSEGNFLWAYHTLSILEGEEFTTQEEVEEALRKFPVGLKAYYERTLQQLVQTKKAPQIQLARKVFILVTAAMQPLRLSEISQAIAALGAPENSDFNTKRVPRIDLVQSLCSGLVVFDKTGFGSHDDPALMFGHKSIRDFFLQDPSTLVVSDDIADFFIDEENACFQLGTACLQYLSFTRYSHQQDVVEMLKSNDHCFLQHASAFWHQYLIYGGSDEDVSRRVIDFLQSPCFWNCVAVQTHTVPHMFARFYEMASGFRIHASRIRYKEDPDRVFYATSLPLWLDDVSSEGRKLVEKFQAFVVQWHPTLNTYPQAFTQCVMDAEWESDSPSRKPWRSSRVAAWSLQDKDAAAVTPSAIYEVSLDETHHQFSVAVTQEEFENRGSHKHIKQNRWSINGGSALVADSSCIPVASSNEASQGRKYILAYNSEMGSTLLHLDGLRIERLGLTTKDIANKQEPRTYLPERQVEGSWCIYSRSGGSPSIAAYCKTRPCTKAVAENASDSGFESEDDAPSILSDTTDSTFAEDSHESLGRCMIIANPFGDPIWSFSKSDRAKFDTCCAIQPTKKVAVWSERLFETCIADLTTAKVTRVSLPEPDHVVLSSPQALRKVFHFSPCGEILYYLLYAADQTEAGVVQKLTVMALRLSEVEGTPSIVRDGDELTTEYACAGTLRMPSIITAWSSDFVYVAMPELCCNPKMLRISLSALNREGIAQSETLKDPIFFPSSTVDRNPKLHVLGGKGGKEKLVLSLDSLNDSDDDPDAAIKARQPPMVMVWNINSSADWRPWDKAVDAESEQYKSAHDTHERLRGTFVDANQRFNVPIRSGMNVRRKAFVSCM